MDNSLVHSLVLANYNTIPVLILVVMDNSLVPRPNKTILIINKLKNRAKQIFIFINRKLTIS